MRILAADIGGTHSRFGLFEAVNGDPRPLCTRTLSSHLFPSMDAALDSFLKECPEARTASCGSIGIAGLVRENRCQATNLPWLVDGDRLGRSLGLGRLHLLNDIEATAWGLEGLSPERLLTLTAGEEEAEGRKAILAPGTGLGQAILLWNGRRHIPFATEAGHATFAPADELQIELWRYLRARRGHVSWEQVLSGPGLENLYRFLLHHHGRAEPTWLAEETKQGDAAAAITRHARDGGDDLCGETLQLFLSLLGSEAGNLALRTLASGGVYLAGGILPRLRDLVAASSLLRDFADKGTFRPWLETVPLHLVLDPDVALTGAARHAALALGSPSDSLALGG